MNHLLEAQPSPLEAWQGVAGHGRRWVASQCGAFSMFSKPRQLSAMGMWPVVVHRANATALQPVRMTRCNLASTALSVQLCRILSDLVRSCQILSHVHWAGLFEQSKSSICGLFQMPVLSMFVVSYQSKGGPVTFEFLGVTSDMD